MSAMNYGEWLYHGDMLNPEKIALCFRTAEERTECVEKVGKSISHLIYRAIEDGAKPIEQRYGLDIARIARLGEACLNWVDDTVDCSDLLRSRWHGSIAIGLGYLHLLVIGSRELAIDYFSKVTTIGAVGHHPQNVLNIMRVGILLGGDAITRNELLHAAYMATFVRSDHRYASRLIDPQFGGTGLIGEMHRWLNCLEMSMCIDKLAGTDIKDDKLTLERLLTIEPQEPFNSALRKIMTKEHIAVETPINRKGLASLFAGVCVELGVAQGTFSKMILKNGKPTIHFAIDKWNDHHNEEEYLKARRELMVAGPCAILRNTFDEALAMFEDESIDCIYIDGYAGGGQEGGRTLENWWPKLKVGGLFAGHDYHQDWPKTVDAVDKFAAANNFKFNVTTEESGYPSWYGRKNA